MQEPPNEGPDDWYFDESQKRWLRYSGRARARRMLDESHARHAEPGSDEGVYAFYARLGATREEADAIRARGRAYIDRQIEQARSPRPASTLPCPVRNPRYSGETMSRHNLELSIETPAYVEQHPELAGRVAGRADDRSLDTPEVTALRASIRQRIRQQLADFDPEQNKADGQAFLAQYGLS